MNIIETNLSFSSLSRRSATNRIILHHAEASSCTPQQIHSWHKANGWSGAGYHFLVRKDGTIYRLRPENTIGAHASGANSDSLGICFEGAYMRETMPQTQIKAGQELVAYLKSKYGISRVQPHRDVTPTDCPGKNFPFSEIAGASGNVNVTTTPSASGSSTGNGSIADVQRWCQSAYGYNQAIDGIWGPSTRKGLIIALQTELNRQFGKGLAVDGIWGSKTYAACVNIKQGAKGNLTKTLQGVLICRGYNTGGFDGDFGPATYNAVRSFQQRSGLGVDGIAGPQTFRALLS